jgi:hypothetical protein
MILGVGTAVTCWICALIIGAIAIWVAKRSKPIHFFAGTIVEPKEISNIPAYNRANALMWLIYACCFVVVGVLSLFNDITGLVLMLVLFIPSLIPLYIIHKKIYNKYKRLDNV